MGSTEHSNQGESQITRQSESPEKDRNAEKAAGNLSSEASSGMQYNAKDAQKLADERAKLFGTVTREMVNVLKKAQAEESTKANSTVRPEVKVESQTKSYSITRDFPRASKIFASPIENAQLKGDKSQPEKIEAPSAQSGNGLNGKFSSPDGTQVITVNEGNLVDKNGKTIGQIDPNGRVKLEGENNGTDVNSFKSGWNFEGFENGKQRTFQCDSSMSSGKVFIPNAEGKATEYEVRMGMLIDKNTGDQVARFSAPKESSDGTISGGYIESGNPPVRTELTNIPNMVMDVQVMGEGGMQSRRLQAATAGPDHFINIQHEIQAHEKYKTSVAQTELNDQGFHPIDSLTGSRQERQDKNQSEMKQADQLIQHLRQMVETGDASDQKIASLERLSHVQKDVTQAEQQTEQKTASKVIELPKLSEDPSKGYDVHSVNGTLRMGSEVYEIRSGSLFKKGDPQDKPSGQLMAGYQVKLEGQEPVSLANEHRVLMKFKINGEENGREHKIVGLGPSRVAENGKPIAGGLVEADELVRQAAEIQKKAAEGDRTYFGDKPTIVEAFNLNAGDQALESLSRNMDSQSRMLKEQLNFTFSGGFDENNFSNNRVDACLKTTQQLMDGIGATGTTSQDLAKEGKQVNKTLADSAVIAATTVVTAGAGSAFAALANAGKISTAAAAAAEVSTAAFTGASASVLGRHSVDSNDMRNAVTGAAEGLLSAGAAIGGRAFAEAGWKSWSAYKLGEATVQTIGYSATGLVREGKPIDGALKEAFDPKNVALGISAQLLGEGAGKLGGVIATKFGAGEKALLKDFIQDAANSYSNAATASINDAVRLERERVAKANPGSAVSDDMLDYSRIAMTMHEAGVSSLATAGMASVLSHGARAAVDSHIKSDHVTPPATAADESRAQLSERIAKKANGIPDGAMVMGEKTSADVRRQLGFEEPQRPQPQHANDKAIVDAKIPADPRAESRIEQPQNAQPASGDNAIVMGEKTSADMRRQLDERARQKQALSNDNAIVMGEKTSADMRKKMGVEEPQKPQNENAIVLGEKTSADMRRKMGVEEPQKPRAAQNENAVVLGEKTSADLRRQLAEQAPEKGQSTQNSRGLADGAMVLSEAESAAMRKQLGWEEPQRDARSATNDKANVRAEKTLDERKKPPVQDVQRKSAPEDNAIVLGEKTSAELRNKLAQALPPEQVKKQDHGAMILSAEESDAIRKKLGWEEPPLPQKPEKAKEPGAMVLSPEESEAIRKRLGWEEEKQENKPPVEDAPVNISGAAADEIRRKLAAAAEKRDKEKN